MEIRKAERKIARLRLGIAGPSGSGKTMGSLKLARGITDGKICLIDTERGSGDLYADLYDYDIIQLEPPFKPEKYVDAIAMAEDAGYDVIIIDSLSHAWSDEGGLLDQADKLSVSTNRFQVWSSLTPQHRKLVNAMLQSTSHIIGTIRSKQEYVMEKDEATGKSSVKKLGMAPVQRDGMEYEFTIFFDVDSNHNTRASKDRTNMFNDEVFVLSEDIGKRIREWLESGKPDVRLMKQEFMRYLNRIGAMLPQKEDQPEWIKQHTPKLTGFEWSEENIGDIVAKMKEHVAAGETFETLMGKHYAKAANQSAPAPVDDDIPDLKPNATTNDGAQETAQSTTI